MCELEQSNAVIAWNNYQAVPDANPALKQQTLELFVSTAIQYIRCRIGNDLLANQQIDAAELKIAANHGAFLPIAITPALDGAIQSLRQHTETAGAINNLIVAVTDVANAAGSTDLG